MLNIMIQPRQHLRGIITFPKRGAVAGILDTDSEPDACADTSPEFVFSFQEVKQLS